MVSQRQAAGFIVSKLIFLAVGGALGTVLRYLVSGAMHRWTGAEFPWGTLAVNLSGALLIGLLWGSLETAAVSGHTRVFLFVGLLGAFTTFSTFAFDNLQMIRGGALGLAALNVLLSNCLGIVLAFAGYFGSRWAVAFLGCVAK